MKISKQIKAELATSYKCALDISILDMKAPLHYINQYIAEDVSGYGTAADEKVQSREDYRKMVMDSRRQAKGKLFKAKLISPYRPKFIDETTAQFQDEVLVQLGDKKNKVTLHLRFTTLFKYRINKWQLVLFHGSIPDAASSSEDTFHVGEAEKKVKELEQVVAERTADLENKNKELEIEAALERVRVVTMAMNTASDILNICQVFFTELKALGFKDLRNALINFWDDKNGLLHDYDYSDFAGGNFAKLPYSSHPAFAEFQKKIRKAKDAFAKLVIKKDGLKSWQQRRRNSGEYKDSRLDKISTLYYYFYSTGVGALGISTFNPISKEEVEMLKKFRNVFDLAYKRYVDIAKAEAQAREAQIEAALERVRSRSMAMHHTSELQEVIHTVHRELLNLNLTIDGGSFIVINSNVGPELRCWGSGGTANTSAEVKVPHFNLAFVKNLIEGIKGGSKFFTEEFSQQQKKNFFTRLFKQKPWADLSTKQKKQILDAPGGYTRSVAVSKHTSIFIINHEGRKFTGTENDLLKRFAKVFEQTYTRFLDLQKAEAQAREAQVQLALERVRARTMAMHRSGELAEASKLLDEQVRGLGIETWGCAFHIYAENAEGDFEWFSSANGALPFYKTPREKFFLTYFKEGQKGEKFYIEEFKKGDCKAHYGYLKTIPVVGDALKAMEKSGISLPEYQIDHIAFFHYGYILFITYKPVPEAYDIFQRFAKVFEQTYTRFLDLQKAEAQAREAQIEAALERVRSRSMAMHSSKELKQVAREMRNQFSLLGLKELETCAIHLWNEPLQQLEAWAALRKPDNTGEIIESETRFNIKGIRILEEAFQKYLAGKKDYVIISDMERAKEFFKAIKKVDPKAHAFLANRTKNIKPDGITAYWSVSDFHGGSLVMVSVNPPDENSRAMLRRFANVFGQAYQRFKDLQNAEAQAREAQIELGLERVRARAMAMQNSDELKELIGTVFSELTKLDLALTRCIIWVFEPETNAARWWMANSEVPSNPMSFYIKYHEHPAYLKFVNEWKKQNVKFVYDLKGEKKKEWDDILFNETELANLPAIVKDGMRAPDRVLLSASFNNFGGINVATLEPLAEEHFNILLRFAKVFDLTYTRFLDLQKAEEQAREAQIQLALERVRAKTMAMQNSAELASTAELLFLEFQKLVQQQLIQTTIGIYNEAANEIEFRATHWEGGGLQVEQPAYGSMDEPTLLKPIAMAWRAKEKSLVVELSGKNLKGWVKYRNKMAGVSISSKDTNGKRVISIAFFSRGHLSLSSALPLPEETVKILERFANAFDGTYTRFLDLQKAEAQAREAQIEAALERVRSRSMAMHKSEELKEVIRLVLEQFIYLKINAEHAGFYIDYKAHDDMHIWLADPNIEPFFAILPYFDTPTWNSFREAKANGTILHTDFLDFKEKNKFYKSLFKLFTVPEEAKKFYLQCKGLAVSTVLLDSVGLYIENFSGTPYSDEENKILIRFGKVFQQTYTRFLDLQKAEAQAREAQVEAALERVRSRTMAMRDSSELLQTAEILFDQMRLLGAELQGVAFAICDKDSMMVQKWTSIGIFSHPYNIDPGEQRMYEAWKYQSGMYEEVYEGEKQKKYFEAFMKIPAFREGLQKMIDAGYPIPAWQKNYAVPFQQGYLLIITTKPFEETQIFLRFGKVFEQTYTRFLDLQKAEDSTKEAIKQAALDRIRADIAAMRTAKDLERIIPLIWNELTILKVPFTRCGVFIMDNEKELIHTFLSTPDGKAIAAIHIPYNTPGKTRLIPENWKKKNPYTDHWTDNDFIDFATALKENHAFESSETYLSGFPHGGFYLHFLPFLQGMLYVGNPTQLDEEETDLIQAVADAFSSAYSRYEDFNKLESAKKQVDSALSELQATQKQLIQSEKMASLGELTAGIAHEIQNPLNFVNNFSEVSNELIDEMKEELEKGNYDDAKEIADDVKQNLEKINHHGKRADAIVKGMLQHSRSSSGQKELTDINALCDEYLRLSYHGLRAKDKSFNAKFETDFDASLPKINVVRQDIGRVILNLINNAFYAVSEKAKLQASGYEPRVIVSTKKLNDKVEIRVNDNGNGIPEKIKDKIFQPFFTTKPTGSGTGLGLSLSYDIVKAHGGEIKMETKEGEGLPAGQAGTEFIIQLPVV
ncbi:MAG: nuclear transport factor 2 family protein [Bacteroidetes bacterium]|nr:nuclear transport factor 2 family protein [Bacteroidota bacterium]